MTKHQVSVAAESFAAASLARAGYDVFVQYGPNQPGYDLLASKDKNVWYISVKGSTDPKGWIIGTKKKDQPSYEQALREWYEAHKVNEKLLFYFVLFKNDDITSMPEMYLTSTEDLHTHLTKGFFDAPSLTLFYNHCPKNGTNKGKTQKIPQKWAVSTKTIMRYLNNRSKR